MDDRLTHFDENGAARMVDVGNKPATRRTAVAEALVLMQPETLRIVQKGSGKKGDVLQVARIAAIQASKRTGDIIPLCHPIGLDRLEVEFEFPDAASIRIVVKASVTARTGVEMEALTAAAAGGLTIYDMCKSVDRSMEISSVRLLEKSGGRSGEWTRDPETGGSH